MKTSTNKVSYHPTEKNLWKGRKTKESLGVQYWYQAIECVDIENDNIDADAAVLGYLCDEGVRRNLGRVGAREGANAFRNRFGKVALHTSKKLIDAGNIICHDEYLEECQDAFANTITHLLNKNVFPIAIGGGHDIAYAHYKGIYNALKNEVKSIGIINFDAHFDLRPVENAPNSGTPFWQIINEMKGKNFNVGYLPVGIQKQANTSELFDIAHAENIDIIYNDKCDFENIKDRLSAFISEYDAIYITIDVDGFSSAYAPGVSAPSSLGFTPQFVIASLEHLFNSKKVVSIDFAELNPKYDIDNMTANLVARLVDYIIGFSNPRY